jgi:hypothetical protein
MASNISSVPKPPGITTNPCEYLTNITFLTKKVIKVQVLVVVDVRIKMLLKRQYSILLRYLRLGAPLVTCLHNTRTTARNRSPPYWSCNTLCKLVIFIFWFCSCRPKIDTRAYAPWFRTHLQIQHDFISLQLSFVRISFHVFCFNLGLFYSSLSKSSNLILMLSFKLIFFELFPVIIYNEKTTATLCFSRQRCRCYLG